MPILEDHLLLKNTSEPKTQGAKSGAQHNDTIYVKR
jgi:hypothetical protein